MKDFDSKGVGVRLGRIRNEKRLSQEQVAAALDISRETYTTIESGRRKLKDYEIVQLAALFDTTTDYILCGIQPDNVGLSDATGLSNDAIDFLKKQKQDAETIPNSFINYSNIMYAIEKLFTTQSGNDLLREIGSFIRCDFTQAYSDKVDSETQTLSPIASNIGFRVNGDLELFQFYRPELFEQSAAELLVDCLRQMRKETQTKAQTTTKKRVRRAQK